MKAMPRMILHRVKKKNSRLESAGFTVIELLTVLTITSLILGVALLGMGNLTKTHLKGTANRIGSVVRYLRNRAVSENLYMRLAFDLEYDSEGKKQGYSVMESADRFMIVPIDAEKELSEEIIEEEKKEDMEIGGEEEKKEVTFVEKYRPRGNFAEAETADKFSARFEMPKGVFVKDVYIGYDSPAISGGAAYIHFFPNGYVEPAVINLKDKNDKTNYSIKINPVTGMPDIMKRYRTMEKEND